ncbi:MAG TPA: hypothetical protein VF074_04265 [Pyrinomonadaceae bacterium]
MLKVVAVVLVIVGLVLGGLAYSYYSESTIATNRARYYSNERDREPPTYTGQTREQFIESELRSAERNRSMALLHGTGSLILIAGGAALFIFSKGGGKRRVSEAQLIQDLTSLGIPSTWASVALANPVAVQYRLFQKILIAFILVFFGGLSILMIVANGFTSVVVWLLVLNVLFLLTFVLIMRRARQKAAFVFDQEGVIRGDNQKFSWNDMKSVDYLMAIKKGGAREYLWRIELIFANGEVWLIPLRVKNLAEIQDLVSSIPTVHQKLRA